MNNDAAILILLADKQREVEALKAEVAFLRDQLEAAVQADHQAKSG